MPTESLNFITPVMRIVQGHPMVPLTTDFSGKPLTTKEGKPTQSYEMTLAAAKTDPAWGALHQQIYEYARKCWPQFFNPQGQMTVPLSLKIQDGDGLDGMNRPNNTKPGRAGHWLLKVSSSFAPQVYYSGRYNPADAIKDTNALKTGDYVRVAGSIQSNGQAAKPGLYVNLSMVELCGAGEAIISGPSASSAFGAAPAGQLPPGATPVAAGPSNAAPFQQPMAPAMPGAPAMGNAPGMPAMPMGGAPTPGMPGAAPTGTAAPAAMPGMAPAMPTPAAPQYVQPNNAIMGVPGGAAPAMPGMPAMPSAAPAGPVFTMTPAAQGYTREQYHAQGWTDDALIQRGMMTRQG